MNKKPISVIKPHHVLKETEDTIIFKQTITITCYICGKWYEHGKFKSVSVPVKDAHSSHFIKVGDRYYVIPDFLGLVSTSHHEKCREVFNLCPPL